MASGSYALAARLCAGSLIILVTSLFGAASSGVYGESLESAEPHTCRWDDSFTISDPILWAMTMTVFDDGSGPALYVSGDFKEAGGQPALHMAVWRDKHWSDLDGTDQHGVNGNVNALATFDDGVGPALFAGGDFTEAGGTAAIDIARWNGHRWSSVPNAGFSNGFSDKVNALAVYDDGSGAALYVGGDFTKAGGTLVNSIARWDGTQWSALSGPTETGVLPYHVSSLVVYDDGNGSVLYVAGSFETAGGVTVNNIAGWNGKQWSSLSGPSGIGITGPPEKGSITVEVSDLAVYDDGSGPALYAAGEFLSAGGVPVNNIARWDGTQWFALGGPAEVGVDGEVNALAVFDNGRGAELYVGGKFVTAGGVTGERIASWNGKRWQALAKDPEIGPWSWVDDMTVHDDGTGPALYIGAFLANISVVRWDGKTWSLVSGRHGSRSLNGSVLAMATYDDGSGRSLYLGGEFSIAGSVASSHVARWYCGPQSVSRFNDGFESGDTSTGYFSKPERCRQGR